MKITPIILAFCCALAWSACTKQTGPSKKPLTADELAALLDVHYWRITATPNDGKPYWGVRLILTKREETPGGHPTYRMVYQTPAHQFDKPVESAGNPQILLGLQTEPKRFTGQLIVKNPGGGSSSTRIEVPRNSEYGVQIIGGHGISLDDNRWMLIEFRGGDDSHITGALCLEFLHSPPKNGE